MISLRPKQSYVLLLICILAMIHSSTAFRILPKAQVKYFNTPGETDLQSLIQSNLADDTVYHHALDILSSIQSSPSCNRVATSTLLDSCHAIDGSAPDTESHIEDLKSVYAAQLAICEITDAGSSSPPSCQSLSTAPGNTLKANKEQISACLQALETRPQWWTSYSNSRQNAVTLCKAARVDIEKDDLIKLHQSMVETQSQANRALFKATKATHENLQHIQTDFLRAKEAFQDQLMRDLEASTTKTHGYLEKLAKAVAGALEGSLSRIRSASAAAGSDMEGLVNNVQRANAATEKLESNVGKVFQRVVEGSSELAHVQKSQWESGQGMATELLASLRNMQDGHMGALMQTLQDMGVRLDSSSHLITQMYDRQNHIEERMEKITQSFGHLETKADALSASQSKQAEVQARLHDQMEVNMQVAQGYLSEVASSAIQLQATVADTSTKIQSMTAFAKIFGTVFDWMVLIVAMILLVVTALIVRTIWRFSRIAGCLLLILTAILLLRDYVSLLPRFDITPKLHFNAAPTDIDDPFVRGSLMFGFALSMAGVYFATRNQKPFRDALLSFVPRELSISPFRLRLSTHDRSSHGPIV